MPASSAAHRLTIVALDYSNRRSSSTRFFNNSGGCTPGANRTVRICSPGNGSTVSSPVSITAVASTAKINGVKIYVDGSVRYSTAGPGIKTTLSLRAGTRQLTVKAWDRFGSFSKSITVNVR
jgi:Bacterial Ig domain